MAQKLKLKQKKKTKEKEKQGNKEDVKQRVALHALQKQAQLLNLREAVILASFILGAGLLRVPMQAIPSAEPITFFAILAGWLFGKKKGFLVGVGALVASNFFVFGGHGPWTLFQALGFGIAGYLGGFLGEKSGYLKTIVIMIIATLAFEVVLNFSSLLIFPFGLVIFLTAIPFIIIHLISNTAFAFALPRVKRFIHEKGQFNERTICRDLIAQLKRSRVSKSK